MTLDPNPPSPRTEYPPPPTEPAPAPPTDLRPAAPARVGDYEIEGELGRGGMGVVFKAHDVKLGRVVAVKMLLAGLGEWEDLQRFRIEMEALANLQHPNIVQVFHAAAHEGRQYLVMEFVEGGNLDRKLRGKPQSPDWSAELVETLARAVQGAHDKGLVHRDLKPANVLLTAAGVPKITDFGLAKKMDAGSARLTVTGAVMGTPSYMAPEQAVGAKEIGPPADIWALGAILYECLTGQPPFTGPGLMEILTAVREDDPTPPSRVVKKVPHDLSTICLKCLHKSPRRRYASAQELADDLRNYLDDRPINARSASALERAWRTVARRPWQSAVIAFALLAVAALIGLVGVERERRRERAEQDEKDRVQRELADKEAAVNRLTAERDQFIAEEYERSLKALDDILRLIGKGGKLENVAGLGPLHERLVGYYEDVVQRHTGRPFANRQRLAQALFTLGQLLFDRGDKAKAREALDKAEQLYGQVEATVARAEVLTLRGRVLGELGQEAAAERDYESALALVPAPREAAGERARGDALHWYAAELAERRGPERWRKAEELYQAALALRERVAGRAGAGPDARRDLAQTYGYLGDLQLNRGEAGEALDSYTMSHDLREGLTREVGDHHSRFQFARSWANLAGYHKRGRALRTAHGYYLKALELRRKLVEQAPGISDYQGDLGEGLRYFVELHLLRGPKHYQALPAGQRPAELLADAEAIFRELAKTTGSVGPKSSRAGCLALRARLLMLDGDGEGAEAVLAQAEGLLKECLAVRPSPEDHYQRAAVWAMQAERATGEAGEAKARKAAAELAAAIKAGYRNLHADDIRGRDRAFKALAGRADFGQALAGLGVGEKAKE